MMVEEIDHAISMENLGLWSDVIPFARSSDETDGDNELQMWALWTMAAAAHHNPKVQDALLAHGSLPLALDMLESAEADFKIRQKCMLLISSLVKQNVNGFVEFTKLSGMKRLEVLFETGKEDNMRDRIAFFLFHLFEERTRLQKELPALHSKISEHHAALHNA